MALSNVFSLNCIDLTDTNLDMSALKGHTLSSSNHASVHYCIFVLCIYSHMSMYVELRLIKDMFCSFVSNHISHAWFSK